MIIHEVEQGTPEWFACRMGFFTASNFSNLFSKETTIAYQGTINRIVYERLTGESPETYQNEFMKRGTDLEPQAREAYELETFNKVHQVGFIEFNDWIGGSPDGLIGKDGILEIKCPKWDTLISYHLSDKIPSEYMYQMQGNLWVADRHWCDFYVWHPKFKPLLKRVHRDAAVIEEIRKRLEVAIDEAQKRIKRLERMKDAA